MVELTNAEKNIKKQEYWTTQIEAWKKTELSQVEYCRQNNLTKGRFTYWKCKLERKSKKVTFMPVFNGPISQLQKPSNNFAPLKLILEEKYQIEIGDGFSTTTLQKLIQSVESIES